MSVPEVELSFVEEVALTNQRAEKTAASLAGKGFAGAAACENYFLRMRLMTKPTIAITAKIKKRILAISTAPAAMPPKPNTAAMRAITRKTTE
jgi:hypothetical protein